MNTNKTTQPSDRSPGDRNPSDFKNFIPERVMGVIKSKGLNQTIMAERLGMRQSDFSKKLDPKKGREYIEFLMATASVLDMPLPKLLFENVHVSQSADNNTLSSNRNSVSSINQAHEGNIGADEASKAEVLGLREELKKANALKDQLFQENSNLLRELMGCKEKVADLDRKYNELKKNDRESS